MVKRNFNQEAIIEKYYLVDENVIELEVLKTLIEPGKPNLKMKSSLILSLNPIERVKENPYGYEITSLKEKKRY